MPGYDDFFPARKASTLSQKTLTPWKNYAIPKQLDQIPLPTSHATDSHTQVPLSADPGSQDDLDVRQDGTVRLSKTISVRPGKTPAGKRRMSSAIGHRHAFSWRQCRRTAKKYNAARHSHRPFIPCTRPSASRPTARTTNFHGALTCGRHLPCAQFETGSAA